MPQPALFVANYIIEYSNKKGYGINNLKLQKLLYFVNARSIVENGCPIFSEPMQKWKYGPVVSSVYHEYKQYGAFEISNQNIVKEIITFNSSDDEEQLPLINFLNYSENSIENKKLIEDTVDALGEKDPFSLVDVTHNQQIWSKDKVRIENGEKNISYTNEEVKEYFLNHEEAQIWHR